MSCTTAHKWAHYKNSAAIRVVPAPERVGTNCGGEVAGLVLVEAKVGNRVVGFDDDRASLAECPTISDSEVFAVCLPEPGRKLYSFRSVCNAEVIYPGFQNTNREICVVAGTYA